MLGVWPRGKEISMGKCCFAFLKSERVWRAAVKQRAGSPCQVPSIKTALIGANFISVFLTTRAPAVKLAAVLVRQIGNKRLHFKCATLISCPV